MEVLNDEIADEALKYARPFLSQGRSADYIPELSKVVIDSLISGNNPEDKLRHLTSFFRKVFNNEKLNYNKEVYLSEKATGFRNRALANFMKDARVLEGDVEEVLDLYFKQCSFEVDCKDIAMLGALLAGDGINPITGKEIVPKKVARLVKKIIGGCMLIKCSVKKDV